MDSGSSPRVVIDAFKVASRLAFVAVVLVFIGTALNAIKAFTGAHGIGWLVDAFRLNNEENIPAFFSGAMLLFIAGLLLLLAVTYRRIGQPARVWYALSALAAFLSFDELFAVHERLIEPVRERFDLGGALSFAWVPVYGILLVALIAVLARTWWRLHPRIRILSAISGLLYVIGAIGFEMAGAARYTGEEGDLIYGILYTLEESFEMAGMVLAVFTLLTLLSSCQPEFLLTNPQAEYLTPRGRVETDTA
ncbi:MAG: hypothetical protein OEZ14_15335 [Acidimicrobiia bacterium]|nr:hypothetical protein [Acidimicrobiia bacterium]MDH4307586.1 hypothetical protein [Acidimicrobiia bacterium]MDH5292811.1 hypothetical protein [Acidimicrobiia bacterium]MDH5521895.1 hypothetical protein [Acidimicrobiia bacterium]